MCNCGNKRSEFSQKTYTRSVDTQRKTAVQTPAGYAGFQYIGKTALTLNGNVTGTQYRFNYHGDIQNIDYRDMADLMSIPVLKKMT